MTDTPWLGDACSLVDAFRSGEITPPEALEQCLGAIERSGLNAVCYVAPGARAAAERADVSLPFGGVPMGIKELDAVAGWPATGASLVFKDEVSPYSSTMCDRLVASGAVLAAQTTASEFGGINCTSTRLHGTTRNPWNTERTPGGSSGGSASVVAGGLLPIASGGDGGGSIRIPSGFTGLFGLKTTFGRIPRGPRCYNVPLTVTIGCLSRSVRDSARWVEVTNGFDPRDTLSLPRTTGWEAGLGTYAETLRGKRAAISVDLGRAVVNPKLAELVVTAAESLIRDAGLTRVDVAIALPEATMAWVASNLVTLMGELGDLYPGCNELFTPEIQFGMNVAHHHFNLKMAGENEKFRVDLNETMADVFERADFVFCATNPDVAFNASGPLPTTVGDRDLVKEFGFETALGNNGALTMPANLSGNPAVSIPIGDLDGLPVGMQVIGRHHEEQLLLDLAVMAERERPWPLVTPGAPL